MRYQGTCGRRRCSKTFAFLTSALLATSSCAVAGERTLRGSLTASPDGQTYLAINELEGNCPQLKVDGQPWNLPLGEPHRVRPGEHLIQCFEGGIVEFDIPEGKTLGFDYWGP